jgi:peroxiredoxin (alkyl hydroperoxide reductase subunit C)
MEDICCGLRVGDEVPDFTLKTYDPARKSFGEFGTKAQRDGKRWTILFFYPADFTFV